MIFHLLKRTFLTCVMVLFLCLLPSTLFADNSVITTLQVIQDSIRAIPSCLHYKVIGLCFWEVCDPVCKIQTTAKVDQYLPDVVVSIYRQTNSNPWDYANNIIDPLAKQVGEEEIKNTMGFNLGYGNENSSSPTDQNIHFKEVDIIGNPAIALFSRYSKIFLPSQATPFMPYYLSLADAYLWRSPLVEMALYPFYLLPGVHIVGSLVDNWGPIYPRTGFIDQPADAKAAAVIAQRAAEIATRGAQPHVYQPLNTNDSCGDHCQTWEATENDSNTQWQMIYPTEQNQCVVFGENDMAQPQPWEQTAAMQGDGNYVWLMWRHYKGCVPGEGKYMGSINFN